ncbi:hypothetical protein MMC16_000693 [Acarospora aff. strigata]|nr:hypothetical protein [Acarospora aff. strigata]
MDNRHARPGQPSDSSTPFVAADYANDGKHHLIVAASGSVATIKLPLIVRALSHHSNISIRIVLTKSAKNFLAGQSAEQPPVEALKDVPNVDGLYLDEDEWSKPWTRGDGILHIELRRWAHILLIAPLSANSLAKMTIGLADNLLLSVVRAWDTSGELERKPEGERSRRRIIVALAMNTAMWRHPITKKQIRVLEEDWGVTSKNDGWVEVLRPVEKELACGDVGDGAMREWKEIVSIIEQRLDLNT